MAAFDDVRFVDRAVLVGDALVLADLHVGKNEASNIQLPVGAETEMVDRLDRLCRDHDPSVIVVAGDLLHSFETIPRRVETTLDGIRAVASDAGVDVVVTPGNHDAMLDVVWSGATTPEYPIGDTLVCHGHVEPEQAAQRYVIGHDHPTITIEDQRQPCYLVGEGVYRGSDLLVVPSFNRLLAGVSVNEMAASDFMSPLVRDADALAPVVDDGTPGDPLRFPPLGRFRHSL